MRENRNRYIRLSAKTIGKDTYFGHWPIGPPNRDSQSHIENEMLIWWCMLEEIEYIIWHPIFCQPLHLWALFAAFLHSYQEYIRLRSAISKFKQCPGIIPEATIKPNSNDPKETIRGNPWECTCHRRCRRNWSKTACCQACKAPDQLGTHSSWLPFQI